MSSCSSTLALIGDTFHSHTLPPRYISMHTTLNYHVGFYGGRKTGEPAEKPSWQGREQHTKQTQLTYDPAQAGAWTWDHRGKRRALSPLRHRCHQGVCRSTYWAVWGDVCLFSLFIKQSQQLEQKESMQASPKTTEHALRYTPRPNLPRNL